MDQDEALSVIRLWQRRAAVSLYAYNRAANRCRRWETRLGACVAALTALIGTSVFATLREQVGTGARIALGTLSVAAAMMSSVRTFAGLGQRVEQYERAARRYGVVRRRLELAQISLPDSDPALMALLESLEADLNAAAENSPNASARIRDRVRREMAGEFPWWTRIASRLRGLPAPSRLGAGVIRGEEPSGPVTGG